MVHIDKFICLIYLFVPIRVATLKLLKNNVFLPVWAACSNLPSIISTIAATDLNNSPVVEIMIVWILVEVGERHAVELGVGERVNQVRLQALSTIVILVERILQSRMNNEHRIFIFWACKRIARRSTFSGVAPF